LDGIEDFADPHGLKLPEHAPALKERLSFIFLSACPFGLCFAAILNEVKDLRCAKTCNDGAVW